MINVIGLGYIGLPTALMLASHGVEVVGTDYNRELVDTLNAGRTTFKEILISRICEADIIAGKTVNHASFQCHIISKAPAVSSLPNVDEIIANDKRWIEEINRTAYP